MADAIPDQQRVQPVFRLMYRSRSRIPGGTRRTELGELFSTARANNKRLGITGALLVSGEWFVQVLEGDEAPVRALFGRIESDPRHDSVALLETAPVDAAVFARWAMARIGEQADEPDIPLIAHTDGISPAAGRPTTSEQELILERMRIAARRAPQEV